MAEQKAIFTETQQPMPGCIKSLTKIGPYSQILNSAPRN